MLADACRALRDEGAAAAPRFHHALCQQFLIGIANGDTADAKLLRQIALRR